MSSKSAMALRGYTNCRVGGSGGSPALPFKSRKKTAEAMVGLEVPLRGGPLGLIEDLGGLYWSFWNQLARGGVFGEGE